LELGWNAGRRIFDTIHNNTPATTTGSTVCDSYDRTIIIATFFAADMLNYKEEKYNEQVLHSAVIDYIGDNRKPLNVASF